MEGVLAAEEKKDNSLTRAVASSFQNYIRKGMGNGGGAKPTVSRDRSIGIAAPSAEPMNIQNVKDESVRQP